MGPSEQWTDLVQNDWFSKIKSILIHKYQQKSTRINTSPKRVNTNPHESDTSQHESTRFQHNSARVWHESTKVQHESTQINTSPTRVNTSHKSQLDHEIIIVYRSLVGKVW